MDAEQAEKVKEQLLKQIENLPAETAEKLKEQIEAASPEEIEEFIKQQSGQGQEVECIFCGIAEGKIDTIKIIESSNILAILDINPAAKGHILIIPKKHFQFLFQIPDNIVTELFLAVKKIMPILINVTKAEGLTVNIAQGVEQNLPHIAINLIPRFKNDELSFSWKRQKIAKEELEKIAPEIKARIGKEEEEEKKQKESEENQKKHAENEIDYMKKFLRRRP